jgi:hypothetical protein
MTHIKTINWFLWIWIIGAFVAYLWQFENLISPILDLFGLG